MDKKNDVLKLDQAKSELIFFSFKQYDNKPGKFRLGLWSIYTESSKSVRNLDIIFDNTLEMEKIINPICKSCYYQMRCTTNICPYITNESCKTLVQTLVIYWLG